MFRKFNIKGFRLFKDFTIDDLKQVTLIGGKNNTGKTSLLEGLFLHCGQTNLEIITRENMWRGLLPFTVDRSDAARHFVGPSFHDYDLSTPIIIQSTDRTGNTRRSEIKAQTKEIEVETIISGEHEIGSERPEGMQLKLARIKYQDVGGDASEHDLIVSVRGNNVGLQVVPPHRPLQFKAHFLHEGLGNDPALDAKIYSSLRTEGTEKLVLDGLRAVDQSITSVEVLNPAGASAIWVNLESGKRMPLSLFGQGMSRLAHVLLIMIQASQGIVLIDEFGLGLHYSVLPDVWSVVSSAAKDFDVQVIATTHSFEVITSGHRSFKSLNRYDQFGYCRLEATRDGIQPINVDQNSLELSSEAGFEVR